MYACWRDGIPLTGFTLPHICSCTDSGHRFPSDYVTVMSVLTFLREVVRSNVVGYIWVKTIKRDTLAQSIVFCVVLCILFIFAIVLSVLGPFTTSDYPFDIFKLYVAAKYSFGINLSKMKQRIKQFHYQKKSRQIVSRTITTDYMNNMWK